MLLVLEANAVEIGTDDVQVQQLQRRHRVIPYSKTLPARSRVRLALLLLEPDGGDDVKSHLMKMPTGLWVWYRGRASMKMIGPPRCLHIRARFRGRKGDVEIKPTSEDECARF